MIDIVLFHSALGLNAGVRELGAALGTTGARVHVPDLFDGETFADLSAGVAKRDALGVPELMRRAAAAVANVPAACVYVGLSMGAGAAEWLALTRPGARGVVLAHGALALAQLGVDAWPGLPLQVHVSARDPWVDHAAARALVDAAKGELFVYDGDAHVFTDASAREYEPKAAALFCERVRGLVRAVET
jgi:dienelactone hydrolase